MQLVRHRMPWQELKFKCIGDFENRFDGHIIEKFEVAVTALRFADRTQCRSGKAIHCPSTIP